MKTSVGLFLTDILPHKRSAYHKIVKNKIIGTGSVNEAITALKSAGVDGVELFLPSFLKMNNQDIDEVRNVLAQNNMPIFSVHQKIRFLTKTKIAEIAELFHIAQLLSAKVIVLHMNSAGRQVFDADYVAALHSLQEKYGIAIGFENREKYLGSILANYGWDERAFPGLMEKTNFSITLDTTHLAHSGGDIISFFQNNKDRIVNIHLSDYKRHFLNSSVLPFYNKHLPLGKGKLPMKQFIKTLVREKYQGYITMEMHTDLAGVCESAKFIKSVKEEAN